MEDLIHAPMLLALLAITIVLWCFIIEKAARKKPILWTTNWWLAWIFTLVTLFLTLIVWGMSNLSNL